MVKVKDGEWEKVRRNFQRVASTVLGPSASPTFAGLTLTGLTASRLMASDSAKALSSVGDLTSWIAGTANEIDVTDDGDGTVTIGIIDPLIVAKGGTGTAALTDHGLLVGSGTSAITALSVAANGQLPIGSTGVDPVLATITGTTDHISVANGAGSITLDLDTNTKTLLGSFNGIFLEKLNFTISEAAGTVTGSLEQDSGGDLIQRFSDGYTTLDCTPALTINLTAYVGTNAVPKVVFVYILQSAKTVMAASNSDWPATEHCKIARLVLKSAATTGTDGGALGNQNINDYAVAANGEGHLTHVKQRLRQEPAAYDEGIALTLKNSAGAALTTSNSSTAVEIVTAVGKVYQLHRHTFPAFDMYVTATDDAHVVNQPTDEGGAYETTADLVTDITHYVDGSASGVAIGVNKYFNLVIWGVQNRMGEASHIMINLPTSQYTTSGNAVSDVDGTSIFEIPSVFKDTGFLIARLTFRLIAGSQWTYIAQEDLRGKFPDIIAGVGITTTDHALLANLTAPADDHTQYILHSLAGAANDFLIASGANTYVKKTLAETGAILEGDIVHDNLQSIPANDHIDHTGVTLTAGSGIAGGGDISTGRTFDLDINSLAVATIAAGDFVPFWDITATATNKKITFANFEATLSHDALADFTTDEHFTQANITATGTITSGTWQGTTVAINQGGTGQITAQAAINALSAVGAATNEHVLTKDTGTGDAIWKVAAGGGANHAILDGSVHSDSVADGVTRGSIIYGNATPKWDELVLGATDTFLGSDGTDLSYRTAAQVMASLSGEGAAAFDLNGQDLTNGGVVFLTEQASAEADVAGKGQLWIKDGTPNTAYFVDDTGIEYQLGAAELSNRTISFTSGMSAATIQALIDAVARNIGPGVTIIFSFGDGTYTLTSSLTFSGFYGGGVIEISGNNSETDAYVFHTTQAVNLDFTNDTHGVVVINVVNSVNIYNLKVTFDSTASVRGFYLNNVFYGVFLGCYTLGDGVGDGAGIQCLVGTYYVEGNAVSNSLQGIRAQNCRLYSSNNSKAGTNPSYGLSAETVAVIGKNGLQPVGGIADEITSGGAVIR